jgi:hypothetical protein
MKGDVCSFDLTPESLADDSDGTEVVPELVTGPNDRATETNGQKPSGALVSELTEKDGPSVGSNVRVNEVNEEPPSGGAEYVQNVEQVKLNETVKLLMRVMPVNTFCKVGSVTCDGAPSRHAHGHAPLSATCDSAQGQSTIGGYSVPSAVCDSDSAQGDSTIGGFSNASAACDSAQKFSTIGGSIKPMNPVFVEDPCSDRQPNLPVFQTVSQDVSKPLKAIFIELCAGSAKLKAACAQAGLTAVAVDQISNRHTTSPCNESGSLW